MKPTQAAIKRRFDEIFVVEPNDLDIRFITIFYKRITSHLKTMPFIFIIPLSFLAAILAILVFDELIVRLVTILQYGF